MKAIPAANHAALWCRRFLLAYIGIFALLFVCASLRGRPASLALTDSAFWAGISASLVIAVRVNHFRISQYCSRCRQQQQPSGDAENAQNAHRSRNSRKPEGAVNHFFGRYV